MFNNQLGLNPTLERIESPALRGLHAYLSAQNIGRQAKCSTSQIKGGRGLATLGDSRSRPFFKACITKCTRPVRTAIMPQKWRHARAVHIFLQAALNVVNENYGHAPSGSGSENRGRAHTQAAAW